MAGSSRLLPRRWRPQVAIRHRPHRRRRYRQRSAHRCRHSNRLAPRCPSRFLVCLARSCGIRHRCHRHRLGRCRAANQMPSPDGAHRAPFVGRAQPKRASVARIRIMNQFTLVEGWCCAWAEKVLARASNPVAWTSQAPCLTQTTVW